MTRLSIIGFGEAGETFAAAAGWRHVACAFDIVAEREAAIARCGLEPGASHRGAVRDASAILSLVTADQSLAAARATAESLANGVFYFDMNSVAPDTKRAGAEAIEAAGGHYIDIAIMSPVNPAKLAVPLLLSGAKAEEGATLLGEFGFTNVRVVGDAVGRASSIKMIRSVMVKGIEALTAEMILAAEQAGVASDVLASLGPDWAAKAEYNLERMRTHGRRRAAEMEEVAKTLTALGVEPLMTEGTIVRQREMAA